MSKHLQYPNGFVGVVSDAVADILCMRPGHSIVQPRPGSNVAPKTSPATLARIKAETEQDAKDFAKEGNEDE